MIQRFLILSVVVLSFIAGGVVVYIALEPKLKPKGSAQTHVASNQPASASRPGAAQKAAPFIQPIPQAEPPAQAPLQIDPVDLPEIADALRTDFVEAHQLMSRSVDISKPPSFLAGMGAKVRMYSTPMPARNQWIEPKAELIEGCMGYWRLTRFKENSLKRLVRDFQSWKKKNIPLRGLILDMRTCDSINDFQGAAEVASLFVSPRTPLFQMQFPQKSPKLFTSERQPLDLDKKLKLIILTSPQTTGAAEMLALLLREHCGALIIGQPTPGEMALYKETRLPSGKFLRQAQALILNTQGVSILDQPILPDIQVDVQEAERAAALQQGYLHGAADVLREADRSRHLNEAALVKEEDVELDEAILSQNNQAPTTRPIVDVTLQAAVDTLKALDWLSISINSTQM